MHCGVGYVLCIRISYSVWSFIILAKGDLFYCLVYPYNSVDNFCLLETILNLYGATVE